MPGHRNTSIIILLILIHNNLLILLRAQKLTFQLLIISLPIQTAGIFGMFAAHKKASDKVLNFLEQNLELVESTEFIETKLWLYKRNSINKTNNFASVNQL